MPQKSILLLTFLLFFPSNFSFAQSNQSETLTITTYYPSPYGVYRNLEVKRGLAVGDITKSSLGSMDNLQPGQMYINNSLILNSLPNDPAGKPGQVIYNSPDKMLKFYDGSKWVNVTGGASNVCTTPGYTCQAPPIAIPTPPTGCPASNPIIIYHYPARTFTMTDPGCSGFCACYPVALGTCTTPASWGTTGPSCSYGYYVCQTTKFGSWWIPQTAAPQQTNFDKSACLAP